MKRNTFQKFELYYSGTLCAIVLFIYSAAQNTKLLFVEIKPEELSSLH
jgi:hypothetical protein